MNEQNKFKKFWERTLADDVLPTDKQTPVREQPPPVPSTVYGGLAGNVQGNMFVIGGNISDDALKTIFAAKR